MKKLLIVLISLLVVVLLSLGAGYLFVYSDSGNSVLKTYVQSYLEEETGLPVEVDKFTLTEQQVKIHFTVNTTLSVEAVSNYDIWAQSFEGLYRVKAKHFSYEKISLRQADVKGHFKGKAEKFSVEGKGSALDAMVSYSLTLQEQQPRNIKVKMKGVKLSEVLALAGQDTIAEGRVDVDINMPQIGEEGAKGEGYITLSKGLFNRAFITKKYGYSLPKGSHLDAKIKTELKGNILDFSVNAHSNLFHLTSKEGFVDLETKKIHTLYNIDVKDLRIVSQNKLAGPLSLKGTVDVEEEKFSLTGESQSLGGKLLFTLNDKIDIRLQNIALEKVLILLKQAPYAKGLLEMTAKIDKEMISGAYDVQVKEGKLNALTIQKETGYTLGKKQSFTLSSKGKVAHGKLEAESTIDSSIAKIILTKTAYIFKGNNFTSNFDLNVYDIGKLMPQKKGQKKAPVLAKGTVKFDKSLLLDGVASGVAKKLNFHYDSKKAKLDAQALSLDKLWALSALPSYVHGEANVKVDVLEMQKLNGSFSLEAKHLVTNPKAMKKLLDKALKLKFSVDSKGKMKNEKVYANTTIKSNMANIVLKNTVFDTQSKVLKSAYSIDIPDMMKLYVLTDKKLYGKMHLEGTLTQDKVTNVWGHTTSLGGKIQYTLQGDVFKSTISGVPVSRIMRMLGIAETILGTASGKVTQNIKTQVGVADIAINGFQIKSSKTTNTVKMFIGKDPARIIFKSTKLHANMKGNITTYTLRAKGTSASLDITQGRLNKKTKANSAKFTFVYETYVIKGKIRGTSDNPKVEIDPSSMINGKVGKEINKGLDKVLKGKMGGFLKGFKF